MSELTCGFIGLGLIGGSIARALKEYNHLIKIVAYDVNSETLRLAKQDAVADVTAPAIDESFSDCDYIFLCAPVQKNDGNLAAVKKVLSDKCLLTDVGSVKTTIHNAIREAGLEHCFIGGHPMAGSERTGYINSKAALLENAYYILTPTPSVPAEKLEAYRELTLRMGAIPLILDYRRHDYVTAAVSHLPHVIAASLVNLVRDSDSEDGTMKMIAAGGFKDITRIASSSAAMWQQICLTNTENISALLQSYIDSLTAIRDELAQGSGQELYDLFDSARIYRDSFINASSGPIKRSYSFNVEIADKTGALAHIAALLAEHELSIKNIGITHNRESQDGVLLVEFYDEASLNAAAQLLETADYTVHVRR
ncbi:MAG: prephenate dehydrogenase/arogenate dehydrogenase family protein [Butyrivibrio sp.]|nr:prephenate dehydrogenase/arogenate dehydrogenase family protein [Acetatifactor muris]MCM1560613.1 prephenate dehydrogenase/arogenate dehydrogenase family protein [Butyrivibrio sp.]